MDVFLALVTPGPQPPLSNEPGLLDLPGLITGILSAIIVGALVCLRKAIGKLFRAASAGLKDRWARLNTPVAGGPLEMARKEKNDAIAEKDAAIADKRREVETANAATRKARHEREMAVLSMEDAWGNLSHANEEIDVLRLELEKAKAARPPVPEMLLPARWTHSAVWRGPLEATITIVNRGPGTAYHVLIDNHRGFSAPEGVTYWESVGPGERLELRASAAGGKSRDTRALSLGWRDADGEQYLSILDVAETSPGMIDDPEDPNPWNSNEPPF